MTVLGEVVHRFFNVERGLTIGDEVKLLGPFPSAQDCKAQDGGGGVGTSFLGGGGGLTMGRF